MYHLRRGGACDTAGRIVPMPQQWQGSKPALAARRETGAAIAVASPGAEPVESRSDDISPEAMNSDDIMLSSPEVIQISMTSSLSR